MTSEHNQKIGIVGAGSVGATIAYACMIRGVGRHISLFDIAQSKVEAEVLDLNHGLMFAPAATLDGSDDIAVLTGADVVVITAGAKQKPGQTRLDLAATNTQICRRLIPDILRVAPDAILLMVTNPVDVLTYAALRISGFDSHRVIGSGTVLDSSRFRFLLAQRCAVAVQNVHAYIAGEHGDSEIPLWSSATIGNIPLLEWNRPQNWLRPRKAIARGELSPPRPTPRSPGWRQNRALGMTSDKKSGTPVLGPGGIPGG
ncbi:MAG TPA: hypothetical protein VGF88_03420 [Acidobacteriaceae bacterium]|jgi:L-lactate dehydrogenase